LLDLKDRKGESVKPSKSAEEVDSFPFPGLHGTVEARSSSGDTPDDPEPKKLPEIIIYLTKAYRKSGSFCEPGFEIIWLIF
jgi:hypothetical protein